MFCKRSGKRIISGLIFKLEEEEGLGGEGRGGLTNSRVVKLNGINITRVSVHV